MKTIKIVSFEYTRKGNSDFVSNIAGKIQAIGANPAVFPNPHPSIAELTAANHLLMEKIVHANDGSLVAKNERDLHREIVTNLVFRLSSYVKLTSSKAGDYQQQAAIIELSKFQLRKPSTRRDIQQVTQLKASPTGNPGEVKLSFRRVTGSRCYIIEKTYDDPGDVNAVWENERAICQSKLLVKNLKPMSKVWLRVIAIGSHGPSIPSQPVLSVVH